MYLFPSTMTHTLSPGRNRHAISHLLVHTCRGPRLRTVLPWSKLRQVLFYHPTSLSVITVCFQTDNGAGRSDTNMLCPLHQPFDVGTSLFGGRVGTVLRVKSSDGIHYAQLNQDKFVPYVVLLSRG